MKKKPCYLVLSLRELLQAVAEAQKPASDGSDHGMTNCISIEGMLVEDHRGKLQMSEAKFRRC